MGAGSGADRESVALRRARGQSLARDSSQAWGAQGAGQFGQRSVASIGRSPGQGLQALTCSGRFGIALDLILLVKECGTQQSNWE